MMIRDFLGQSHSNSVVYAPKSAINLSGGTRTGKITVNDNAANNPQTVYLSGTGQ